MKASICTFGNWKSHHQSFAVCFKNKSNVCFIKMDTLYLVVTYIKCIRFNETDFNFKETLKMLLVRIRGTSTHKKWGRRSKGWLSFVMRAHICTLKQCLVHPTAPVLLIYQTFWARFKGLFKTNPVCFFQQKGCDLKTAHEIARFSWNTL